MFGAFTAFLFAQLFTYYGWASKQWNDWVGMGISIFGLVVYGVLVADDSFDITRRRP